MPIVVSPRPAALIGAEPDLVYWLTLACSAFRYSKPLLLAHQLHDRREHRVGGAGGVRVGDLDLALELGLDQVGPAFRLGQVLLGEQLLVVAEAERAGIDADGAVVRRLGLLDRPVVQLAQHRRPVFLGQAFLGGLQVRVAGAGPPDVALGVGGLGLHLGVGLAGALARHVDGDAGLLLEVRSPSAGTKPRRRRSRASDCRRCAWPRAAPARPHREIEISHPDFLPMFAVLRTAGRQIREGRNLGHMQSCSYPSR